MRIFAIIFALLILIVGTLFAILNAGMVSLHYYLGVTQIPLSLLLFITFMMGSLCGYLICLTTSLRQKWTIFKQSRKIKKLEP